MFHPGNAIAFVAFNWTRPLWQDHRVREAVARRSTGGRSVRGSACWRARRATNIGSRSAGLNPDAIAPDFDPAEAERLLDEAGYPRGADGVRLRIGLAYRSLYAHYGVAARIMAEQLARIGVVATVEGVDPFGWKSRFRGRGRLRLAPLDSGDIGPDPQLMASFLTSDGPRNSMRYRNDAVDRAFREGRGTIDREARGRHYRALQDALAADIARVPFMQHGEHPFRPEYLWAGPGRTGCAARCRSGITEACGGWSNTGAQYEQ
ncbi:MAG: ABC transporter substrate-binding protein [Thermomicrobiales bacterium]